MKITNVNDLPYDKDINIWEISNQENSSLLLLQIDENTFQLIQNGIFQPLITNTNYILIDKKYRKLLNQLSEQVILKEVTIIHKSQNLQYNNYLQLSILHKIIPDMKKEISDCDLQIWEYCNSIFISESLKNKFIEFDENEFIFLAGFPLTVV